MNDRTGSPRLAATVSGIVASIVAMTIAAGAMSAAPGGLAKAMAAGSASVLVADKGKLKILVNGQPAATEEFEIHPDGDHWIAQGAVEVKPAQGPASRVHAHLTLQPDGTPVNYQWKTEGAKKASASIAFQNSIATIELQLENAKPFTQQFTFTSPQIAVLDNNVYHQYAILAHLYDGTKKGVQTFSVLVPQEMVPGSVTVESLGSSSSSGAALEELRVKSADLEVDVFMDPKGRLMRILVPSANAEIVRE
jgi:hypothetical protein